MKITVVFLVVAVSSCSGLGGLDSLPVNDPVGVVSDPVGPLLCPLPVGDVKNDGTTFQKVAINAVDVSGVLSACNAVGLSNLPGVGSVGAAELPGAADGIGGDTVDSNAVEAPDVAGPLSTCLVKAVLASQPLLLRLAFLLCTYDNGQSKQNDENWKAVLEQLSEVMKDTVCQMACTLKIKELKELGEPTANIAKKILNILRFVLDTTGLSKPAFQTACCLTKQILKPTCLPMILGVDTVKLLVDLALACVGINKQEPFNDLMMILKKVPCILLDSPLKVGEVASNLQSAVPSGLESKTDGPLNEIILAVLCRVLDLLLPNITASIPSIPSVP